MALIDDRQGQLLLYTLPGGALVLSLETDPFVFITGLSNSGTLLITVSEKGVVEMASPGAPARQFELPGRAGEIRQMQVADDGQGLLFLAQGETAEDWRLDFWRLPFGDGPEASQALAVPQRPRLVANGTLDRLAYWDDGDEGQARLFALKPGEGRFQELWALAARPVAAQLNHDWTWLVVESGLAGWERDGRRAGFSGSLRDRLIFTSQGHLLAYGGVLSDRPLAPNETMMRFRLLDPEKEREIGQLERPVEASSMAQFMVSEDLTLYDVRAGEEGALAVTSLGAFGDPA
jgi:hypothetical protein